jgi:DNA invertase Pin-like site-specific DNA recombinase
MTGKHIGYIRVSTIEQNLERQLEGIKLDRSFVDKVSGKSVDRPALQEMLAYVRDGDTIIVHSMDRLARNVDDLRQIVNGLTAKQVKVKFIKEALEFTGEDSPISNLLLSVMGAFAEFERTLIKERQMEGIELAKKRGTYIRAEKHLYPVIKLYNLKNK